MAVNAGAPDAVGEDVTELDEFWLETTRTAVKESISSLEEAAKQLIGAVTLVEGIYFAAVSFSDLHKVMAVSGWETWSSNPPLCQSHLGLAGLPVLCYPGLHSRDL